MASHKLPIRRVWLRNISFYEANLNETINHKMIFWVCWEFAPHFFCAVINLHVALV